MKPRTNKRSRICDAFNRLKRECINNYLPIEEEWIPYKQGFQQFYNHIIKQYNKAEKKWNKYNNVVARRKPLTKGTQCLIYITLKIKEKGLTKRNILITNASDAQKVRNTTHKIIFEDQLLSTRDIQNILKKRGVSITIEQIAKRIRTQQNVIAIKVRNKILYQNKYMNAIQIEKINNIHQGTLKGYLRRHTFEEAKKHFNIA
jgi:hypothetical protein